VIVLITVLSVSETFAKFFIRLNYPRLISRTPPNCQYGRTLFFASHLFKFDINVKPKTTTQPTLHFQTIMTRQELSTMCTGVRAHFPIHQHSVVLNEQVTAKVLRYAQKRIQKSNIVDYAAAESSSMSTTGLLQHSQVDLGKVLGHGSFSSVYDIRRIRTDDTQEKKYDAESLVVKVLRPKLALKPTLLSACAADIVFEGLLLSTLNHKNIVSLKAMSPMGISSFANGRHDAFFLVMEKLHETLGDKIARWQKQSKNVFGMKASKAKNVSMLEEQVDAIMQLSEAIQHLHSKRILYRDAKPANTGFDKKGTLKIFDFDVSKIIPQTLDPNETFNLTKRTGSPRYMAPEVAKGEPYNLKADVYSFGLICHEIISLEKPFGNISSAKHDQAVFYDGLRPEIPTSWPQGFRDFLEVSWSPDITARPTMNEAIQILQKELSRMVSAKKSIQRSWSFNRIKTSPFSVSVLST
jgi:serine/threonine protein kinase